MIKPGETLSFLGVGKRLWLNDPDGFAALPSSKGFVTPSKCSQLVPRGPERLGYCAPTISPMKGHGGRGQVFQYSRGGVRKEGPYSPSPPSLGPQKVATPGNATASGSLRTGAGALGLGVAVQTRDRSRTRGDAGAQSPRDTCEAV